MTITELLRVAGFFNLLSLAHGVILGTILVVLASKKRPSLLLGFFLIVFGLSSLNLVLSDFKYNFSHPQYIFLPVNFYFLTTPVLFLYVKGIISKVVWKDDIKHFVPGIVEFFVFSFLFFYLSPEQKLEYNYSNYSFVFVSLANLYCIFYLVKILLLIKKNRINVDNYYSSNSGKLLEWLTPIVYCLLVIFVVDQVWGLLYQFFGLKISYLYRPMVMFYIAQSAVDTLFTYWMAFFGIRQYYIIFNKPTEITKVNNQSEEQANVSQIEHEYELVYERLLEVINDSKCYTNEELTIVDLADLVSIHYRKLSKIINQEAGVNFNTFINKYRVEEAKNIMNENNRQGGLTLDVVGQEAGFKSRSSLYAAFKKFEDKTPAKFMKLPGM